MSTLISLKSSLIVLTLILLVSIFIYSRIRNAKKKKNRNTNFGNDTLDYDESKFELISPQIHNYHNANDTYGADKWNSDIATYLKNNDLQIPGTIYEWFYRIAIGTGDKPNGESRDNINAFISLNTNKGTIHHKINLENTHRKGIDNYFIKVLSVDKIEWVEIKSAFFKIDGDIRHPDDWFMESVDISLCPLDQTQSTDKNSYSYIKLKPNTWLADQSDTIPNRYHTGNVGKGRLTFVNGQFFPL